MSGGGRLACLFVAEKPSIAKVMGETLSQGSQRYRASASQYNPIYEFQLDLTSSIAPERFPGAQGCRLQIVVTSVSGHLMGIDFESKSTKNWRATPQRELFDAALERTVTQGQENVANNLAIEAKKARVLVIWTDCDREGEAIGEEISIQCLQSNPALVVRRAVFSAANQQDLWRAVNSTRALDTLQIDAVNARQEIDLRLGAVFTRFQTLTLGDSVSQLSGKMVSFGPCQFPTLGFIVARYESILAFTSERFWQLKMTYNGQFHFTWHRNRVFDYPTALTLYQLCVANPQCTVEQVTRRPTSKRAPTPLSTVELQVRASKWLKLDSETAMRAAESLYQRGIISYPRTETEQFSDTFDLKALIQLLLPSPQFGAYAGRLLDDTENLYQHPRPGAKNDQAHPPIHPLKFAPELHEVPEIRVYEFVCRHFLACCSRDAVGFESAIKTKCSAELFTIKGLQVMERNYLDIYVYDRWGERAIPETLVEGNTFVPSDLVLTQGETTPPELLTEAELIRLMDKHGIGTDATIAEHIKTVQDREYASKQNSKFAPSNLGVALIRAYNEMGHENVFSRPSLRGQMERDLKLICSGSKTKQQVVQETIGKYRQVFLDVLRKKSVLKNFVESVFMGQMGDDEGDGAVVMRYDELLVSNFSICGTCQAPTLELRKSSVDGKIGLRCSQCSVILGPLPSHVQELKPRTEICPLCRFQVVNAVVSTTNSWAFCPQCFVHPPQLVEDMEDAGGDVSEMPCYKCTNQACALSQGVPNVPLFPCSEANCATGGGMMELRKFTPQGGRDAFYQVRCKNYPTCKAVQKLPGCCKEVTVAAPAVAKCTNCNARKLKFTFNMSKVMPGTPNELTECPNIRACVHQSRDFRSVLQMEGMDFRPAVSIHAPRSGQQQALSFRPRQNAPPTNGQQQTLQFQARTSAATATVAPRMAPPPPQLRQAATQVTPMAPPPPFHQQQQQRQAAPPPFTPTTSQQSFSGAVSKPCKACGQQTIERIATTQANSGRVFFKCEACNAFEWKDDAPQQSQQQPPCYHCGQVGHAPVQCPRQHQQTASAPSTHMATSTCYRCQQVGHWASQCPNKNAAVVPSYSALPPPPQPAFSSAAANSACYKCKQPGHFANACPGVAVPPPQPTRAASINATCHKCKQPGHYASKCPNGAAAAAARGGGVAPGANKKALQAKQKGKPRSCASCHSILPPRKRKCEVCGTGTMGKRSAASHDEPDDEDDY